jgi:hypothetical protein
MLIKANSKEQAKMLLDVLDFTGLIKANSKEHAKILWDVLDFTSYVCEIENKREDCEIENIEIVEVGNVIHE